MSPLRKSALAWCFATTALAASALGGSFIYLRNQAYFDPEYVETNIDKIVIERGWESSLETARKAGYTDKETALFISRADTMTFERDWSQLAITIGILYTVIIVGIAASTLMREARADVASGDA